jgi:hypothetical protein
MMKNGEWFWSMAWEHTDNVRDVQKQLGNGDCIPLYWIPVILYMVFCDLFIMPASILLLWMGKYAITKRGMVRLRK